MDAQAYYVVSLFLVVATLVWWEPINYRNGVRGKK